MKRKLRHPGLIPIYGIVLVCLVLTAYFVNVSVTASGELELMLERKCIVIDPGHGGIDGGATSCTGVRESKLNLEIALTLNDLFHLLGMKTNILRTEDISIHTEGNTIAAQKVSDLKERVRRINQTVNAILISIHQNNFQSSIYSGAQVFYPKTENSEQFAKQMQQALANHLAPDNNRQAKQADSVYIMEKIQCPGVLIECGFLSNPTEEAKLRSSDYQKQLCCVIAATTNTYLYSNSN